MHNAWKLLLFVVTLAILSTCSRSSDPAYQMICDPENTLAFFLKRPSGPALKIDTSGWGPNWTWVAVTSKERGTGSDHDASTNVTINKDRDEIVNLHMHAHAEGKTIALQYTTKASKDIPLTLLAATIAAPEGTTAKADFITLDEKNGSTALPAGNTWFSKVKSISFTGSGWGPVVVTIDPPSEVAVDKNLRIVLASEMIKAGEKTTTLTWTFPNGEQAPLVFKSAEVAKFAPEVVTPDWFPYQPKWNLQPSAISMESWRQPAGASRPVLQRDDHFEFPDGTPVKFFGTNLSFGMSAPSHGDADFTAARFAKFGVNAVRMHKFTGPGWEGIGDENDATRMKPEGLDNLDYFSKQLSSRGVYYGWSHAYHFKVRPANKARIAGYDELMKNGGDTYGVINWAEDVQDILIEQVVALLNHKNPYTGTTYATDPALAFVEFQNEDDIFFLHQRTPTTITPPTKNFSKSDCLNT